MPDKIYCLSLLHIFTAQADRLKELEAKETELQAKIQEIMYTIPQMIDPSVPIGPDDSHNVEVQRFGEPVVPDYPCLLYTSRCV